MEKFAPTNTQSSFATQLSEHLCCPLLMHTVVSCCVVSSQRLCVRIIILRRVDFLVQATSLPLAIAGWKMMRKAEAKFNARRRESVYQYVARLKRTALGLHSVDVKRAVQSMHRRVRLCVENKGGLFIEGS